MKCRIIFREIKERQNTDREQLRTYYKSNQLIVQGDDDVKVIELDEERKAILIGIPVGICSRQGEIMPLTLSASILKDLLRRNSLEKCRGFLEGRYLLVVAGPGDACTICADRYGQRDLYIHNSDDQYVFVSDLSLMPESDVIEEFDQVALAYALTVYGCRPPKRQTLYKSISRLGVGESVQINDGKVCFLKTPFVPASVSEYGEKELNKHADLMLDAVRVRGSQYGNVVYLSSGWDSTSILACLVHLFGARKVRAVIGRMRYAERSGVINPFEIERAQAVADYFRVPLEVVEFDYRQKGPNLAETVKGLFKSYQVSGVTGFNHHILADFVARTSNGDEAVFAGEISDGAYNFGFSQYTTIFHPVLEFRQYSDKMASYLFGPTFFELIRSGSYKDDLIYNLLRRHAGEAVYDEPVANDPIDSARQLLSSMFLRSRRLPFYSLQNNRMLTEEGIRTYTEEMERRYINNAAESVTSDTLYSWYLYLYNSFHWQSSNVATLDLTAEAHGFNIALPFRDSRIQEFLSSMPENFGRGLDLNPTKYPLKWMLKNRIDYPLHLQVGPHSYLYDVAHAFNHTAELVYGSALNPYFKELLHSFDLKNVLSKDIFDLTYIENIITRYIEDIEVSGIELRDLMFLCQLSMSL